VPTWLGELDAVVALGGRCEVCHFQCSERSENVEREGVQRMIRAAVKCRQSFSAE
jgi:hypothetical protein